MFGKLLGVGRDRAYRKSHVFMGIWTYNGCCKPECEVSKVFCFFKHYSSHTLLFVNFRLGRLGLSAHLPGPFCLHYLICPPDGASGLLTPNLTASLLFQGGSRLVSGFLAFSLLFLLPCLLYSKFHILQSTGIRIQEFPRGYPGTPHTHVSELAPRSLPPTLLLQKHPSLRQKEQPSQIWMILPQASCAAQ